MDIENMNLQEQEALQEKHRKQMEQTGKRSSSARPGRTS